MAVRARLAKLFFNETRSSVSVNVKSKIRELTDKSLPELLRPP